MALKSNAHSEPFVLTFNPIQQTFVQKIYGVQGTVLFSLKNLSTLFMELSLFRSLHNSLIPAASSLTPSWLFSSSKIDFSPSEQSGSLHFLTPALVQPSASAHHLCSLPCSLALVELHSLYPLGLRLTWLRPATNT